MKTWLTRLFLVLALALLGWLGWRRFMVTQPVPVTVQRVERGLVEETVTNSRAGTVKAHKRARLSPEIGGRVVDLPFREGDAVSKGDVLLRLDDGDLAAAENLARRDLDTSRAREKATCLAADLARREWERNLDLSQAGLVTSEQLDRLASEKDSQAASCRAARAAIKSAEAAVRVATTKREKTILRAPFDGVLASLDTEVGEWVSPAPPGIPVPPVIDLIKPGSIYISAPLDEVDAARVSPGQRVRITLDPYPDQAFPGRLTRVAPFVLDVEEQNRTFEVEAEFQDTDFAATLLPGTSADVEVILQARENVLRIPSYALLEENRVLVVADGFLAGRPVEIGLRNWAYAEIISGLKEGDPVVVSLDRLEVVAGAPAVIEKEVAQGSAR